MGGWLNNLFQGIGNALSGAGRSVGQAAQGVMGQFNQGGSQQPSYVNRAMTNPTNLAHFRQTGQVPNMPQMNTGASRGAGGFMQQATQGMNMPQMLMGAGVNALGQFMAPKVNTPQISQSPNYQALQNFQYNKLPANAEESINRSIDMQQESELRNLRNVYKNVRPGTDYTTDSAYQRDLANLQRTQTLNRADALAGPQLQYAQADQQRLQELASADVGQIMLETGMNAQEAEQFKQSFSNIGSMLMQNAMPQQGNMAELMKLFQGGQ